MKHIAFISILLSLLCFGCGEENIDSFLSLEGTRWKLVGIVDETRLLKELEPKDCDKCYTLTFDTDSSFLTFTPANELGGGYIADYHTYSFQVTYFGGTKVFELDDGDLYSDLFWQGHIQSFFLQRNELRLYYNNKNYLLYKSQRP